MSWGTVDRSPTANWKYYFEVLSCVRQFRQWSLFPSCSNVKSLSCNLFIFISCCSANARTHQLTSRNLPKLLWGTIKKFPTSAHRWQHSLSRISYCSLFCPIDLGYYRLLYIRFLWLFLDALQQVSFRTASMLSELKVRFVKWNSFSSRCPRDEEQDSKVGTGLHKVLSWSYWLLRFDSFV